MLDLSCSPVRLESVLDAIDEADLAHLQKLLMVVD